MRYYGYISALDGYRLLQAGIPLYIVSAPLESRTLPLEGGWVDDDGVVYLDCTAIVLNPETALRIGREYNQQCILRLYPCYDGKSEVYLLRDTPFSRQVALEYAGGYTADGEWLFTAVDANHSPFTEAYEDCLPVDMEFIPVK